MQAYHEATETVTVSVRVPQRECENADYARRSTVEESLDTGSIPVYSTSGKSADLIIKTGNTAISVFPVLFLYKSISFL